MRPTDILKFMEEALRLKRTPRSGWAYYGIEEPESVAAHNFSVALLALVLAEALRRQGVSLDTEKILKLALLHELGEIFLGDLHLKARKLLGEEAVFRAEAQAVREAVTPLGLLGEEFYRLWEEFEKRKSPEALVVRAADKLELLLQARDYQRRGVGNLDAILEAWENRRDFDFHPLIRELARQLIGGEGSDASRREDISQMGGSEPDPAEPAAPEG